MVAQPYDDPEVPRWTPVRALIWKEWRQQRLIALGLPAGAVALCALFTRVWLGQVGAGAALVLGAATLVTLAANAFSGETDDRTCLFLGALPWPRPRLFWIKFGTALAVAVAVTVVMGVIVLYITVPELRHQPWWVFNLFARDRLPSTAAWGADIVLACALTLAWAAVVASAGAGALLTFLVTALLGGLVTTLHGVLLSLLLERLDLESDAVLAVTTLYFAWVTVVTLTGGWWLWSTPWPSRFHWLWAVVLVIVTPLMAPVLALVGIVLLLIFGPPAAAAALTSMIFWQRPETATQEKSARVPRTACKRAPTGVQDNEHGTADRHQ